MSSAPSSDRSDSPSVVLRKRKRESSPPLDTASGGNSEDYQARPVLSHAEQRRQKRANKLVFQKKDAAKKHYVKDGTAASLIITHIPASKRQNSVWVGNMSFKTTQQDIKTFFEGIGEISRIHLPLKTASRPGQRAQNCGFAYVDFTTSEEKEAAIALSEQPLLGRKLLIKDGGDFTGRPERNDGPSSPEKAPSITYSKTAQKILRAQKQRPAPTLFLGNLGFETTEQDIRQLFEAHRQGKKKSETAEIHELKDEDSWIRRIRMGTFEDSGNCKGFAFVDFTSVEHSTSALTNTRNHQLNGRKLVVEYASPDAVRRGELKEKKGVRMTSSFDNKVNKAARLARPRSRTSTQVVRPDQPEHAAFASANEISEHHMDVWKSKRSKTRMKPGAVLALARRESAAIIPSEVNKITFQ